MKTTRCRALVSVALICALSAATGFAAEPPQLKMTTPIPAEITTPDAVETRLGTLKFFDRFPDQATVDKVYNARHK